MIKHLLLLLVFVSYFASAQFSSNTKIKADSIENNTGTDIILNPSDKVDIQYFTGEKALQSTVDGELEESAVTNTELGYVSGVTSGIQGQIDGKQDNLPLTTDGDLLFYNAGFARLPIGAAGQILTVNGSLLPEWQDIITVSVTTKGDLQTYSTQPDRLGVGSDGQILSANSTTATGLEWIDFSATPTTTLGDLIYRGATEDVRLPIGSQDQLLTVSGGIPSWQDAPVSTTLTTKGDIQTYDTANARLPVGSDTQILSANSLTTTGLEWIDPPSTSPTVSAGDIIYNDGTGPGNDTFLPIGSEGYVLSVNSGLPTWEEVIGTTLTSKAELQSHNGTDNEAVPPPTNNGQYLASDNTQSTGMIWVDFPPITSLNTKGQLQGYSTENANVGPCTNNQVLVYDAAEATGWKCYDGLITTDYDDVPVGTVMSYGSETLPAGYLLADGQCVLKAQYAELYDVIGANTTECTLSTANDGFNVPNLENAFLRGRGGARTPFDTEGQAIQSHNHDSGVYVPTAWNKQKFGYTGSTVQRNDTNQFSQDHRSTLTGSTGGGETRPANTSVVYMIKAVGRAPITNVAQPDIAPNKAGFITWAAFDSVIQGHLKANGDCVLKTDYPDYFNNVGTTFGECTITTTNDGVNLPDLITDNRFIRAAGGSLALGTTQADELKSHSHNLPGFASRGFVSGPSVIGSSTSNTTYPSNAFGGAETRPKNMALTPYVRMVDNDIITGQFEQIASDELIEVVAYQTASQTLTDDTPTKITYDNEIKDDLNVYSNGVFTCPNTSNYQVSFNVYFENLFASGSTVYVRASRTSSPTINAELARLIVREANTSLSAATYSINCDNVGDTWEFQALCNEGDGSTCTTRVDPTYRYSNLSIIEQPDTKALVKNLNDNNNVECQSKTLSADVTSAGNVTELTFNNLTIGKKYRVFGRVQYTTSATGSSNLHIRYLNNGANITQFVMQKNLTNTAFNRESVFGDYFTATGTTADFNIVAIAASLTLNGNGSNDETTMSLCELPDNYILNSTKFN